LTALLLILAAFGGGGTVFAVACFTQVAVCASDKKHSEPHRVSEQQPSTISSPQPIHRNVSRNVSRREHGPRDIFPGRELFQRPPPSIRFSHA
jgi:hypothetical protein